MILVLNTWELNILTICLTYSRNSMAYSLTWPATNLLASIQWDYPGKCCRLSMPGYIDNLLLKFNTLACPSHVSPYACLPISYGSKSQLTPESDTSTLLDNKRKLRIQKIVGSLLYYARAVDNKLLVALSAMKLVKRKPLLQLNKRLTSYSIMWPHIRTTASSTVRVI